MQLLPSATLVNITQHRTARGRKEASINGLEEVC